jgi:hypothetical protein
MRNLFLKLRVIFVALIFITLITGFLIFPREVGEVASQIEQQEGSNRLLLAVTAVLADVVLLVIIFQELGIGAERPQGLVVSSRGSRMEITPDSIQRHLDAQLGTLEDVFAVRSIVRSQKGRVMVEMEVDAHEKIDVRKKTAQLQREISKIIEKQIGLKLAAKPVIRFQLMSEPSNAWLPDTPTEPPEDNPELLPYRDTTPRPGNDRFTW